MRFMFTQNVSPKSFTCTTLVLVYTPPSSGTYLVGNEVILDSYQYLLGREWS
jgi:hypothetical protein